MLKKSQAAFEYLSTYGWALLIALAVIWMIIYFGILNPENFMQEKCAFGDKLLCEDQFVDESGTMILRMFNSYDDNIIIEGATGLAYQLTNCAQLNITAGEVGDFQCTVVKTSVNVFRAGKKLKLDMILHYRRDVAGSPMHDLSGQIITRVQEVLSLDTCADLSGVELCYFPEVCPNGKIIPLPKSGGICCAADCIPAPQCSDGEDNDGDGRIDWDGGDLGPGFSDCGCIGWDDPYEGDCNPGTCINYCDEPPEFGLPGVYECCVGLCSSYAPDSWCCSSGLGNCCFIGKCVPMEFAD